MARKFGHLTAAGAARLARAAGVSSLILNHVSRRYAVRQILAEARAVFEPVFVANDFDRFRVVRQDAAELVEVDDAIVRRLEDVGARFRSSVWADLDGDGRRDLVLVSEDQTRLDVWQGRGSAEELDAERLLRELLFEERQQVFDLDRAVLWLGSLPGHFKVDPQLSREAAAPARPVRIHVVVAAGEPERRVLEILAGSSPTASASGKDGAWRVIATVPALGAAAK